MKEGWDYFDQTCIINRPGHFKHADHSEETLITADKS